MNNVKQRKKNAMIGLAIGDAISWTAMFNRSYLLPEWTRRKRREIDLDSESTNVIALPMPFSLNQDAHHFDISPTLDTEWAAFTAEILLNNDTSSFKEKWTSLAQSKDIVRGSVSTQTALYNIRNGILPPQSGKENPHYFDDSAMSRAIPIGVYCVGEPDEAIRITEIDASITNYEDGVWAAQAMAVAISLVCAGEDIVRAIEIGRKSLPESSWTRRLVDDAIKITDNCDSIFSVLPELHNKIVNREYSYGNVAPETLALTFAIARLHGNNFETAVTTASSFSKSGETLPAMVGALVGASQSNTIASETWLKAIEKLKGICLPALSGKNYLELIERLSNFGERSRVK